VYAYFDRGDAWADKQEYDEAIRDFDTAIQLKPWVAVFYCSRGKAWIAKQDFGKAIKDFDQAKRLDPKYEPAQAGRRYAEQQAKDAFAKLLVNLTNEARAKQKLPPLKVNDLLTKAAVGYSGVMVEHDKKAHEHLANNDATVHELGGKRLAQRLDDGGYAWAECGENIAIALGADQFMDVFSRWMKSRNYRDNILSMKYAEIGLGIVKHPQKDEWYITQIFGTEFKK
jgi:uncharacterized protein YkwD